MGGISIWQLLIILAIVLLIFGTKKFRSMGGDLGSAVKGFKNAMADGEKEPEKKTEEPKLDNKMDNETAGRILICTGNHLYIKKLDTKEIGIYYRKG